jgi:DNA-directed RNA polymerase subunit RPC12/RpoP
MVVWLCKKHHEERHIEIGSPLVDYRKKDSRPEKPMTIYSCKRCGRDWCFRGTGKPLRCGECKSPYWDKERVNSIYRGEARNGSGVSVRYLVDGGITQRGRAQTAVQIGKSEEDSKAVQIRPTPPEIEAVMCKYTEYDPDTGETMACGLPEHGPKIKHARWRKL